jgi:L,D-transpeptidase YbiS
VAAVGLTAWGATGLTASARSSPASPHRTLQATDGSGLSRLAPRGVYVVVDTGRNRLSLRRGDKTLYTAVASTGSGAWLVDPRDPARGWRFDTPRGVFAITGKHIGPVWIKPDWAFIEEGLALPSTPEERIEAGVLGRYALGFGNGYFIHGTLYTRLLGTNVTHGCIRLGDQDLEHVFKTVQAGATVIVF